MHAYNELLYNPFTDNEKVQFMPRPGYKDLFFGSSMHLMLLCKVTFFIAPSTCNTTQTVDVRRLPVTSPLLPFHLVSPFTINKSTVLNIKN